ncbi:hypothetical protein J2X05_002686 [Cellvibrio fibrivorans]|uniref:RHS repeat-associated core domain-containing protein n=2 Tax=Cellvibrio fibrivorans TaxID=126350 RepID=A0ABU1UZN2_9GAMM|nr:hypothetical protein [Cellvibrio fibrivorans]
MNGRVYDPELGRFMSADPFVQAPYNSQSYNRYSYVFNNPLSFTDPSGYKCYEVTVGSQTAGGAEGSDKNQYDSQNQTISTGGSLCGWDAYYFSQDWLNNMERYLQAASPYMVPQYARQSMEFNSAVLGVPNTLDLMDAQAAESAQEISDELQASGHATIATLAGIVVLTYGDKNKKKHAEALSTDEKAVRDATGKGNNITVKTQKEAERILEKVRPNIPWNYTYGPKTKTNKQVHPVDGSGNAPGLDYELPHIKWRDWSDGKSSGVEGHIYFESVNGGV